MSNSTVGSPPPANNPPAAPPPSPTVSSPPPSPPDSSSPPPPSSTTNPSPPPQSPPTLSSPPPSSPPPQSPPSTPSPPPPSNSKSSPPPSTPDSPPPPSPSKSSSPPPPSDTPPSSNSPPKSSPSPPPQSSPSPPSYHSPPPSDSNAPPPPTGDFLSPPPPHSSSSPPPTGTPHSPIAPSTGSPPSPSSITPPASNSSQGGSGFSPPSTNTTSQSDAGVGTGAIAGGAVAGVVILLFATVLFMVCKRSKKRRPEVYASQYLPPNNFPKSDVFYYGPQQTNGNSGPYYGQQQYTSGNSGPYGSQIMYSSPQGAGNNYGSQRYQGGTAEALGGAKSMFSYEELMEITNGFSRQNILGEGGFGCVYKGWLPDGKVVAVKQLKAGSGQGEREFRAEVEVISRVHHRHLLSMVGYCISEQHRLLIYEFVPNNTLEHHLHGKGLPVLDWSKRLKIAIGSAKGLAYLHDDCHPKIIHRDIKSANILLEDSFEAQVADFGLAKLSNDTFTHVSTRVMGTFGYMAPEYASSGKLTDRSDVFSFGVVLLELITGRKPVDASQPLGDESLVEWARPLLVRAIETGDFSELVDPRLEKHYVESEMLRMVEVAAACVRHSAAKRPRMVQVVRALDSEGESDLSNGVKVGQSTIYDSNQYNKDISKFRMLAFGSGDSSEFDMNSGDYTTKETSIELQAQTFETSSDYTSSESETQAMNTARKSNFAPPPYF